ncbi:MAG: ComF family protein [Rhodobacteraceae bacterium]|nr:ComF family protein [Paracoccaceae bacterium]
MAKDRRAVEHMHAVGHGGGYGMFGRQLEDGAGLNEMSPVSQWLGVARRLGTRALDAVLPPQCLACGEAVDRHGGLCAGCFSKLTFITRPYCCVCGVPIQVFDDDDAMCGACIRERPTYRRARGVFAYTDEGRDLVLKLKHADRTDLAVHLAQWMMRDGGELIRDCDVIVPVPIHRWRLAMRTFNQAALLARAVSRLSGKPMIATALQRTKPTPSQGGLDRQARRRNVAGAFKVEAKAKLEGKAVLLIDDVLTTGATADACSRALLRAGVGNVDVLVLARVPNPGGSV